MTNSLGIGPPLDAGSTDDLRQLFAIRTNRVSRRRLATTRVLAFASLGSITTPKEEHRPTQYSATTSSLLRVIALLFILPTKLYSPDGRIKRRQSLALVLVGRSALLLP